MRTVKSGLRSLLRLPAKTALRIGAARPRTRLVVLLLLVVLAIGTGVPATLFYGRMLDSRAADGSRAAATAVAKSRIERILTYHVATLDQDLQEAKSATTGEFGAQFGPAADSVIAPAARRTELNTTATVLSVGVLNANRDSVDVLAFVNRSTTSKDKPQPEAGGLRLRVTLDSARGQWLVSRLAQL
jgi:Mce-associated membrane protein